MTGWPTDTKDKCCLGKFQHMPLVSHQARQYDPVLVDLHQTDVTLPPLQTRDECASASHQSRTPKFSYIKKMNTEDLTTPKSTRQPFTPSAMGPVDIPSASKPYSPSPQAPRKVPLMLTGSAQRRLDDEFPATTAPHVQPGPPTTSTTPVLCKLNRYDPLTVTVSTSEGRLAATDVFLNVCRLLSHHSKSRQLQVGADLIKLDSLIYVREPCSLFRREILSHLTKYTASSAYMPPFASFMEAMLRPVQIYVNGVYDLNFSRARFYMHFFPWNPGWSMTISYLLMSHRQRSTSTV